MLDAKKPLVFYAPKMRLLKRQMERSFSVLMAIHVAYAKVSSAPKLLFVLFVQLTYTSNLQIPPFDFLYYSSVSRLARVESDCNRSVSCWKRALESEPDASVRVEETRRASGNDFFEC